MKTFSIIFTHVFKSDSVAGDAYINKMYNHIKNYLSANTPITTFYTKTKHIHSNNIEVTTSLSVKNVEEKYLKQIDDFIENDFKKQWDPNIWVECMEEFDDYELLTLETK